MFFINGDLSSSTKQKNLREVINDDTVKVAYGVLSLRNFFQMVKNEGSSEKIFIPKVQRGLVWKSGDKQTFLDNCILGTDDGMLEPMPNIFLFCDSTTGEVQLFDGLQRTSAILKHFKKSTDIINDIMIPAALFKGTREEAEKLFKNINEKGVKLNDFEKLASRGGEYEIDSKTFSNEFNTKFNEFVNKTTKQYEDIGLHTSQNEATTLYEILVYAIYKFSATNKAKILFNVNEDAREYIFEWGFQLAYSTTTKKESKIYTKKSMISDLLSNFGEVIGYDISTKTFDEKKLDVYIVKMSESINNTEVALRDIYNRNIVSRNKEFYAKKALASAALVGSVVIFNFLNNKETDKEKIYSWYLKQLITGRMSSNTNKLIDELIISMKSSLADIKETLKNSVLYTLRNNQTTTQYMNLIWDLFYIQKDFLYGKSLTTQLEIDHIFPKSKLLKLFTEKEEKEMINHIGNLAMVDQKFNNRKKAKIISEMIKTNEDKEVLMKYYAFGHEESFEAIMNATKLFLSAYNRYIKDTSDYTNKKNAKAIYKTLVNERASIIVDYINGTLD
ncbi:MAG: DUF1524 domain-containing protein [Mycoplasmataceae bacterium]|nr:DUF1524 domain-containing protein [Mycoplasmataceae bacterium]